MQVMAEQLRGWASDVLAEDRQQCAAMLDAAGEYRAARLVRETIIEQKGRAA